MRRLSCYFISRWIVFLLAIALFGCITVYAKPLRADKAYDFYLTGERICRDCYWRMAGPSHVELTNGAGIKGTYRVDEVIGVDQHPILRRLHRKSIEGVGLPGRVLVPSAFDDERRLEAP